MTELAGMLLGARGEERQGWWHGKVVRWDWWEHAVVAFKDDGQCQRWGVAAVGDRMIAIEKLKKRSWSLQRRMRGGLMWVVGLMDMYRMREWNMVGHMQKGDLVVVGELVVDAKKASERTATQGVHDGTIQGKRGAREDNGFGAEHVLFGYGTRVGKTMEHEVIAVHLGLGCHSGFTGMMGELERAVSYTHLTLPTILRV